MADKCAAAHVQMQEMHAFELYHRIFQANPADIILPEPRPYFWKGHLGM